jgi:hypothetical protein
METIVFTVSHFPFLFPKASSQKLFPSISASDKALHHAC